MECEERESLQAKYDEAVREWRAVGGEDPANAKTLLVLVAKSKLADAQKALLDHLRNHRC